MIRVATETAGARSEDEEVGDVWHLTGGRQQDGGGEGPAERLKQPGGGLRSGPVPGGPQGPHGHRLPGRHRDPHEDSNQPQLRQVSQ